MYTDEELKEIATKVLVKLDKQFDVKEAEIYIQSISQMMGGIEYRTPKDFQSVDRVGCAIRFFKENQLYFACFPLSTVLDEISNLSSIISYSITCKKFDFPEIKLSSSVSKIYDKRVASLNEEEMYNISYSMNELENKMEDIILDGSILFSLERKIIVNTSQKIAFEKSTWCDVALRALYRGYDMISSSEKHLTSRQIPSSVSSIVEDLVTETIQRSAPSEVLDKKDLPVVFSPMAFAQIFSFSLVPSLSKKYSKNIQNIEFSDDFNLIDDGTVPGLPNSTSFDDEGISQAKTNVIRKGVFETALNNSQYAEENEEMTGNSFRVKMFELFPRNYQSYPEIFPSNLLIGEGSQKLDQLIQDIPEGIFINSTHGYMTADYYSGTFKISANDAYKIEKGSIEKTLQTFDVIGNIHTLLRKNPLFTEDRKVVRPINTPYSILAPYLHTEEVSFFL